MVNFNDVLYVTKAFKNILRVLRLIRKGFTMGVTKDKMTIK